MTKSNKYKDVISRPEVSFWIPLLIPLLALAVAWGTINARVSASEAKLAEYPSQDYFTLKFQNMDDRFTDLQKQISELKVEVRAIK